MDPERDVCVGCCRTLEEIALWSRMSDDERQAVMRELPARREQLSVPPISFGEGSNGA